jgi:hypothetical protein
MEMIPTKLWVILALIGAALLADTLYPLLAAIIGIAAAVLFLWLLMGGGR